MNNSKTIVMKKNKFSISEVNGINGLEIIIKNDSTNESFSILPDSGARLCELFLHNGVELISVIKKIKNVDSESRDDIFTNAKLSPFAGRIKAGEFTFKAVNYYLVKNYPEENNACHGFVFDKKFVVTDKKVNEDSASCTLEYHYTGDVSGYPFPFLIELTYQLSAFDGLTCTTKINNLSDVPIPLSDGWHFYFELGMKVDDLKLKIETNEMMELDPQMIPIGKRIMFTEFRTPHIIDNRHFDSCFKVTGNKKVVTQLLSAQRKIDLRIWQETGTGKYEYLVIYTPPDRKSIAIEPISSNINTFNNGEGLITLAAQETFIACFGISLNKIV
jgi:aldose 1-epimerase